MPEHERDQAEAKFKAASQAYEILYDDEKRHLYDTHGMAAFDPSSGAGAHSEANLDDILQFMFGMNEGTFADGPRRRAPRKGVDEEQEYEVTLEELYRGKTAKFAITKSVVCSHCKGSGGKEKAKPKECAMCHGKGVYFSFLAGILQPASVLTFYRHYGRTAVPWPRIHDTRNGNLFQLQRHWDGFQREG